MAEEAQVLMKIVGEFKLTKAASSQPMKAKVTRAATQYPAKASSAKTAPGKPKRVLSSTANDWEEF
jgi:hypothetical protein